MEFNNIQDTFTCFEVSFERSYVAIFGTADPGHLTLKATADYSKYKQFQNKARICQYVLYEYSQSSCQHISD